MILESSINRWSSPGARLGTIIDPPDPEVIATESFEFLKINLII